MSVTTAKTSISTERTTLKSDQKRSKIDSKLEDTDTKERSRHTSSRWSSIPAQKIKAYSIRNEGLKKIKSTNAMFDHLVNYRTFRPKLAKINCTGHETGKIQDHLKRLHLTLKDHKFYKIDLISVFEFLQELVGECNTLMIK